MSLSTFSSSSLSPLQLPMRALSASELMDVWEWGWNQPPVQRALALLAVAFPETPGDTLAELSIGQRDLCLLTLREQTFGSQLAGLTACPECDARLELSFDVRDVRVELPSEFVEVHSLNVSDYQVRFRVPNSLDLSALTSTSSLSAARQLLFERCLLSAQRDGEAIDQLPVEVVDAVSARMAEVDPQADVRLALVCPVCRHNWEATFDIVSFFWSEINAWALRILREVHMLASAYGWCESEILALSQQRRQFYLEMVGG